MREFFRPFRRKLGAATLMLACLCLAGWIRSDFICDGIVYPDRLFIASGHGVIAWIIEKEAGSTDLPDWKYPVWERGDLNLFDADLRTVQWHWRFIGFAQGELPDNSGLSLWTVQWWLLALPPTILSAYLLLTKPRPKQADHA